MELITTTYQKEISFTLSCYDSLIPTGTIPELSYAGGMTSHLYRQRVRIFGYPRYAEPFAFPVTIDDGCWIGGGVIIVPGVTVGKGSVIGAGSVVTKNIPNNSLDVENPCRVIRKLNGE